MTSGQPAVRGCLYHTALLPRVIRAPVHRQRNPANGCPQRGERALIALDVFDGTTRRTDALLAHLHCNGYDITTVSGKLRKFRALRNDLALAFTSRRHDPVEQLQRDFETGVEELCSAISSLKQRTVHYHDGQCHEIIAGNEGSRFTMNRDPAACKHAILRGQHA